MPDLDRQAESLIQWKQTMNKRTKLILVVGLLIIGTLSTLFGAVFLFGTMLLERKAVEATATVIEIKTSTGRTTSITYSPVLKFTTLEGKDVIYDVSRYDYTHYRIGQKIEVLYSSKDPNDVNIKGFYYTYLPPLVVLALGAAYLGFGVYCYKKLHLIE
ncbi:MAG: DUF3592 domain-containing protein [Polyangia bacterium]